MPLIEPEYKSQQTILKVYGYGENKKIKILFFKSLQTSGLDIPSDSKFSFGDAPPSSDGKLPEAVRRAKSVIFELAYCNPWDWFFTGTLDPKKYDRSNLDRFHKDLMKWISNYKRCHELSDLKVLLIPEKHADGKSWHVHGFIYGLPVEHLKQFQLGDKMGKAIADKVRHGDKVYKWDAYTKKFGFCDLEPIRNIEAASKYVEKYMTKDLAKSVTEYGAHLYYHSRGLNRAETIKKGFMAAPINPDYETDFCSVQWLDYSDKLLEQLSASITRI